MHKDTANVAGIAPDPEKKFKEDTPPALPVRCRYCDDLPNCDLVFCLRWWH